MIRVRTDLPDGRGGWITCAHACQAITTAASLRDRLPAGSTWQLEVDPKHRPCHPQPVDEPVEDPTP